MERKLTVPSSSYSLPADWTLKVQEYHRRMRSWGNTPSFRSVPRRNLPVNSYSDVQQRAFQAYHNGIIVTDIPTSQSSYWPGWSPGNWIWSGFDRDSNFRQLQSESGVDPYSEPRKNDLRVKLLVKIADVKINSPVMQAEAHKTAKSIEGTAERIFQAMVAVRERRFKAAARILDIKAPSFSKTWKDRAKFKDVPWERHWLEYKYGWIPLLMDVKGTAEFFAQQWALGGRPPREVVRVSDSWDKSYEKRVKYTPTGGAPQEDQVETLTVKDTVRLKAWVELNCPFLAAAQQAGLTNPLVVAWELVPYSFVFDWFIQVGDWLTALTATNGLTIVRVMESMLRDFHYVYDTPETTRISGGFKYVTGNHHSIFDSREYYRSIPVLDPLQLRPVVRNPFNDFVKLVTAVGLIKGRIR